MCIFCRKFDRMKHCVSKGIGRKNYDSYDYVKSMYHCYMNDSQQGNFDCRSWQTLQFGWRRQSRLNENYDYRTL